jgi:hypothetical protein
MRDAQRGRDVGAVEPGAVAQQHDLALAWRQPVQRLVYPFGFVAQDDRLERVVLCPRGSSSCCAMNDRLVMSCQKRRRRR